MIALLFGLIAVVAGRRVRRVHAGRFVTLVRMSVPALGFEWIRICAALGFCLHKTTPQRHARLCPASPDEISGNNSFL